MEKRDPAFPSIGRPSITEEIIEYFKQALIRGDLRPGQRLPSENELALQMDVGRSAVREAMKVLAALGIVTIRQGDGTYIVDEPSPRLLSPLVFAIMLETGMSPALIELRSLIQTGYTQLAAQKMKEEDWRRIQGANDTWADYARSPQRDIDQLATLDLNFHFAILEATHSPLVIKIGRTVEELFFMSIRKTLATDEDLSWAIEGHQQILDALQSRDLERIHQSIVDSLGHWRHELEKENTLPD